MGHKPSVLILTTSFPIEQNIAVGIHVMEMAKHLQLLGHPVKVIAPHHKGVPKKSQVSGIDVIRFSYFWPLSLQKLAYGDGIPTNLRRSLMARIQLPLFLFFFFLKASKHISQTEIIHSHWSIAGMIGVLLKKCFKRKTVLSMHGAEVFVLGKNKVLNYVLKHTDLLINNSNYTQGAIKSAYPKTKCMVIQPGTDPNRFYPKTDPNLRKQLGLEQDDIFVLCIGKFIPRKGIKYLIEAIHLLVHSEKKKNIKLRIGGRGYLKDEYERQISHYGLEAYISFLGYISDEDLPTYYTAADLFVLPSIVDENGDTEGLGVVLVEANACETPVIASDVGGITDVVQEGENGLLMKPGNAGELANSIKKLADDEELRKKMGKKGRQIVQENFSWPKIAEKMSIAYQKLK